MPDDLYTVDILRWSDQQADLLRRLARGERVNDAIDWENVAEEVESVGRSELTAVKSLLMRALGHLIKVHVWPDGPVDHWRHEALTFLSDAQDRLSPSMRQAIDLARRWRKAATLVDDGSLPLQRPIPPRCPLTLEELLPGADHDRASIAALLAALNRPETG